MIAEFNCNFCNTTTDKIIPKQKEFESTKWIKCPLCKHKAKRVEWSKPAKFMGTFYGKAGGTAPSKRYSYKKSKGGENGNKGSAV